MSSFESRVAVVFRRSCLALLPFACAANGLAQCAWNETFASSPQATFLGASVALDGDLALVGAPFSSFQGSESGSAHLFDAQAGWTEVKTLLAADGAAGRRFGAAVALEGGVAVVGTPTSSAEGGLVYVFERDFGGTGAWGQSAQILGFAHGTPGLFGCAVALDQETLVVGAYYTSLVSGRAYVFRRDASTSSWSFVRELAASDGAPVQYFGTSVAIHGDRILVGARNASGAGGIASGAAYVFARDAGGPDQWGEIAKLSPSDGADDDRFGSVVALGPSTLVVGSPQNAQLAYSSGAAYVFERGPTGTWSEVRKLVASDGGFAHDFGGALALAGDEILVGARRGSGNGEAYVFERDFGGLRAWGERERIVPAFHPQSEVWFFGSSVAFEPGRRVIGAHGLPSTGEVGSAYVYDAAPALVSYCAPSGASGGCRPKLTAIGCASAAGATPFRLLAHGLDAEQLAIVFYGVSGRSSAPFGPSNATLCVRRALQRSPVQFTAGTPGLCDGTASLDWNAFGLAQPFALGQPFHAGQTFNAQAIGREPSTATFSGLSDAIEFTLGP